MKLHATATYTPRASTGQFIAARVTPGVRAATQAAGELVADEARSLVHVVSGRLKASIDSVVRETEKTVTADVIADTPYAAIEEFRTGGPRGPGHSYMRPALDTAREAIRGLFRSEVSMGLKR